MSDEREESKKDEAEEAAEEVESPALSALLKRSLSAEAEPTSAPDPEKDQELLLAVQKKLRQRSKGKFYADGWSTTQSRVNYVLVAMIMLVTIVVVYLVMGPTGFSR